MARRAGKPAARARADARTPAEGFAYRLGWYLFLAFVVLTPVVMGALPPQLGALAVTRALDPVSLPKAVTMLALSGLSLAAFCVAVVRGEAELRWHRVLWVVLAFVGWAAVSTAVSPSVARSVLGSFNSNEGLVALAGYALVAFLAVQYVRSTPALRTVATAAVVSGSLVAAYAALQWLGVDPFVYTDPVDRVFATFGNADMLGTYLLFPLALAAGLALSERGTRRSVVCWSAAALTVVALLATLTRGAWIGGAAMLLTMVFAGWRPVADAPPRRKALFGAAGAIAAVATAAAVVMIRPRRAGSAAGLSQLLERLSNGRTIIWLTGLRGWLVRPFTGWGPEGFGHAFDRAAGADWYAIVEGLQRAENAHDLLIQTLVTLGIPGLVLMLWALVETAIASAGSIRSLEPGERELRSACLAGLAGLGVALLFGVTLPSVSVWLWLTVGLLLAPLSRPVSAPRAVLASGVALGAALSLWAGSWLAADVCAGWAQQQPTGDAKVAALARAVALDPISPDYRWLLAEAETDEAVEAARTGADADEAMQRGLAAFYAAAAADPGDAMVRVALSNVLLREAARQPSGDAGQGAAQVAAEAVVLAPRNPAALAALAHAYEAVGRHDDASRAARLAREVAPAYAMQTLGSLGLEVTTP